MKIRILPELVFPCVSEAISYRITSSLDVGAYRIFHSNETLWLDSFLDIEMSEIEFYTIENEIELVKFPFDGKFYWTSFFSKIP